MGWWGIPLRVVCAWLILYQPVPDVRPLPVVWVTVWSGFLLPFWETGLTRGTGRYGLCLWLALLCVSLYRFVPGMVCGVPVLGSATRLAAAALIVSGPPSLWSAANRAKGGAILWWSAVCALGGFGALTTLWRIWWMA